MKSQAEILREAERLPEKEEIIILSDGTILIDIEGSIECNEIGEQIGSEIFCG